MRPVHSVMIGLSFACALLSAGCSANSPTGHVAASAEDDDHHHHDHEHDHGIPDHKPATFADAVRQLPRRHRLVMSEFKVGHLDHAREAIQKLQDFIRWLPELAADTDLGEADWNAVQSISRQMEAILEPWPSYQAKPDAKESETLSALIEQLKPLAEKTKLDQAGWLERPVNDPSSAGSE